MEFLSLVRETKKLDEDIKRQRREFNSKIKEKVKVHKCNKKEIEEYLKEAINSREYEYREIEVKSSLGKQNITTYYPFLKPNDAYEVKEESFIDYYETENDYEYVLYRKYTLYNKDNGMEVKVKEYPTIRLYKKGSNDTCMSYLYPKEETINAAKQIYYEIKIEGMKFEFRRSFDVSKL